MIPPVGLAEDGGVQLAEARDTVGCGSADRVLAASDDLGDVPIGETGQVGWATACRCLGDSAPKAASRPSRSLASGVCSPRSGSVGTGSGRRFRARDVNGPTMGDGYEPGFDVRITRQPWIGLESSQDVSDQASSASSEPATARHTRSTIDA